MSFGTKHGYQPLPGPRPTPPSSTRVSPGNGSAAVVREDRKYLPTLSDLVDRLSIVQMKMIFIPGRRAEYLAERGDIMHDIDLILASVGPLDARAIMAITMIQLSNRCIWESESKARSGGNEQNHLLRFTHSVNGVRNTAKNILAEIAGGRKDYKIDALAADLPEDLGNWNVFDDAARG